MSYSITHHPIWATTSEGSPIELYHPSHLQIDKSFSFAKPPLLFIGGVHGDEPEGVALAQHFLKSLKQLSVADLQLLRPWLLIPCLNPDGYKADQRTNARGVDLNRNFSSPDWSPECTKPRYFPGIAPESEKETQALVALIKKIPPEAIIHFHSWEPCIVYTGAPGKKWADKISEHCGYSSAESIGYPTPGSLGEYGWQSHKIPVICIEEKAGTPLSEVGPRFEKGLYELLKL